MANSKVFPQLELIKQKGDEQPGINSALNDQMATVEEDHCENTHLEELLGV
jgi:hypothetical protein